jgi:hypothetical protein
MLLVAGGSRRLPVLPLLGPVLGNLKTTCSLVTCRLGLSGAGSVGIVSLPLVVSHLGSSTPNFN